LVIAERKGGRRRVKSNLDIIFSNQEKKIIREFIFKSGNINAF
jgi:hypothetical protein